MNTTHIKIIAALLILFGLAGWMLNQRNDISVGGDGVLPIAGQTYTLAGAGISSSETSITLTSLTIPQIGYKIQDSDVSDTFYVTIEPGSRSRQEIVSCTTVTQNADDTATLSGCSRGLSPITPYTASSTLQFSHAGGSTVIFSDPPQLFNQTTFKDNDETITGTWLVPTPTSDSQIASKGYVDGIVNGGTVVNDRFVVAGTGGETLATSTLVYFDGTDQEWKKVDTDDTSTFVDKFIGLTQGAGTDGAAITDGVLLKGRDNLVTGLTAGSVYYASTSAGTIDTVSSIQPIGVAEDTDILYFDPVLIDVAYKGQDNTFSGQNTFSATTTFSSDVTFSGAVTYSSSTQIEVFTSSGTWSKPDNISYIVVEVVGGGGDGGAGSTANEAGGSGGGGGYSREILTATDLAATTSVNVTVGAANGTSDFGGFLQATGGADGEAYNAGADGGAGGVGSGGDININGQGGAAGNAAGTTAGSGPGGNSFFGGGARGVYAEAGQNGTSYGGGASGGHDNATGGTGASGVVIVTEYFN